MEEGFTVAHGLGVHNPLLRGRLGNQGYEVSGSCCICSQEAGSGREVGVGNETVGPTPSDLLPLTVFSTIFQNRTRHPVFSLEPVGDISPLNQYTVPYI